MAVITVTIPKDTDKTLPERCEKTMRRRTKKQYGATVLMGSKSLGQCSNKPAGWHRGRAYCAIHLRSFGVAL